VVLSLVSVEPCNLAKPAEKRNDRRRTLKILAGGGVLALAAVGAASLNFFSGGSGSTSTVATSRSETVSTASTMNSAAATTATMGPTTVTTGPLAWPRLKATNVASLQPLKPLWFYYPLIGTGNFMVRLGVKADNGVGPDGDIVAFSAICQHQGCGYNFAPPTARTSAITTTNLPPGGTCGCHGSYFDFVHNGAVIGGPAPYPVPRVLLEYDNATGDIYVVGMGPPTIYGQGPSGITDPAQVLKYDLEGKIVTQITLSPA
jgi:arsenite oxidase small subunit